MDRQMDGRGWTMDGLSMEKWKDGHRWIDRRTKGREEGLLLSAATTTLFLSFFGKATHTCLVIVPARLKHNPSREAVWFLYDHRIKSVPAVGKPRAFQNLTGQISA